MVAEPAIIPTKIDSKVLIPLPGRDRRTLMTKKRRAVNKQPNVQSNMNDLHGFRFLIEAIIHEVGHSDAQEGA